MQGKRVLVPIDYSEFSQAAVDYATDLARGLDAELVMLHVVDPGVPTTPTYAGPMMGYDSVYEAQVQKAQAYLDELTPWMQGVAHRSLVRSGFPATEIVALAKAEPVDVIVMATHGRTGLSRLVMGSTTEAVLRTSPVPVLTLRTANLKPGKTAATSTRP
jgi:nucleotide-binding universal stress UspA family protein